MIDLAEHNNGEYIKLMDVARRQGISEKYLEGILSALTKNGLLLGVRGKGGGYKLAVPPESCSVGRVIKATEGSLAPVACLESSPNLCPRAGECRTLPLWQGLNKVIDDYLEGITLAELTAAPDADFYCI